MKSSLIHAIFFLSGFAALGLQLAWTRMFSMGIGHELAGVLAVISAFFGGLALGAFCLDKPIAASRRPGHVYALLEAGIGLWALASLFAIPLANRLIFRLSGLQSPDLWHWSISFAIPFLTLLPATFCMGGTLPAVERMLRSMIGGTRPVPGLYAANTLGAVLGVFTAVFLVSPRFGYRSSIMLFAGTALLCSLAILGLAGKFPPSKAGTESPLAALRLDTLLTTLFLTGFLGIGFEVVCTRALSQFFEDSVFTYAVLLMIYLLGTASGAFGYKRWSARVDSGKMQAMLLAGLGLSCLFSAVLIPLAGPLHDALVATLEGGRLAVFLGETAAAAMVFLLPTLCMGALFSHLAQNAKDASLGLGRALAVNTLGGALAPFLIGVLLVPALGIRVTLLALGLGYAVIIRPMRFRLYALGAAALPGIVLLWMPWSLVTIPPGSQLRDYHEGAMSSVAVLENGEGGRSLKTDNRFYQGGTISTATERLKSHLPLLLHPGPKTGLWIGMGTGITFGAAVDYPGLTADAVELDPGIVVMLPHFSPQNGFPYGGGYRVFTADARRFIRSAPGLYDVVVADFFQPNQDGAATLYTVEHFDAIRSRLAPGGIFCQWLPLYQLDFYSLRIIIRTFMESFPDAQAFLGNFNADLPGLALVGGDAKGLETAHAFERRIEDPGLRKMLAREGLSNVYNLAAFYFASGQDLATVAGNAPLNVDNHPRVMYINPGFSSSPGYTPFGRLDTLLLLIKPNPEGLTGNSADSATASYREAIGKVLTARNLFLRGAISEARGDREGAFDLYLQSAVPTPNFVVGYAKCLMAALEQGQENPDWSKALLLKLAELRPEIEDARILMREMFGE